jgi:hypothetical protein
VRGTTSCGVGECRATVGFYGGRATSRALASRAGTCSRTSKEVMNGKNSLGNSIFAADINKIWKLDFSLTCARKSSNRVFSISMPTTSSKSGATSSVMKPFPHPTSKYRRHSEFRGLNPTQPSAKPASLLAVRQACRGAVPPVTGIFRISIFEILSGTAASIQKHGVTGSTVQGSGSNALIRDGQDLPIIGSQRLSRFLHGPLVNFHQHFVIAFRGILRLVFRSSIPPHFEHFV